MLTSIFVFLQRFLPNVGSLTHSDPEVGCDIHGFWPPLLRPKNPDATTGTYTLIGELLFGAIAHDQFFSPNSKVVSRDTFLYQGESISKGGSWPVVSRLTFFALCWSLYIAGGLLNWMLVVFSYTCAVAR